MAILRAGPFTQFFNPWVDEPASANQNFFPVNPAIDETSATWKWRKYTEDRALGGSTTEEYSEDIAYTKSITSTVNGDAITSIVYYFAYQSGSEFDLTFDYSATATGSDSFSARAEFDLKIFPTDTSYPNVEVEDRGSGAYQASISGQELFTFPPSIVPRIVQVRIFGFARASDGVTTASLTVST